jgi:uncharacterized protein YbaR (Trm112 family)
MKVFLRLFGLAALIGVAVVVYRAVKQYREDSVFDLGATTSSGNGFSAGKRSISPVLLAILADPADAGGNEWLINRRNGFRYPVEDGIPIMLLEEGEKNKDESLISR